MHTAETLIALGGAFVVAGVLAKIGRRLGLPTIPLFVIAGIIFGPHTPGVALIENPDDIQLIASLGLIFLLFYLGLEFSFDQLMSSGRRLVGAAAAYLVLNVGAGLAFGFILGWGVREAFVLAGVLGISSSAIVTKLLVELRRVGNRETPVILGIIVVEDVFLAFYLALLQPVLSEVDNLGEAVPGIARSFAFLLALALIARFGTRIVARLIDSDDTEVLVVLFVGLAVVTAGLAEHLGVSDAIGAFMIGMILGSTRHGERIRNLTHPLRDAFGAIFFFHFGLTIDPGDVLEVAPQVVIAVIVTAAVTLVAGAWAARLYGWQRQEAVNIGLTVLTRGEFALILASMALSAGLDPRIGSFTAGYVLLLALVGPMAVTNSHRLVRLIPRRMVGRSDVAADQSRSA